jgi:hypothetical protein
MATKIFYNLLNAVQTSGLNFKIEMSPFSATIVLKNSILKDRNGIPLNPSHMKNSFAEVKSEYDDHVSHFSRQVNVMTNLQANLQDALDDLENVKETNINLEKVIDNLHTKLAASEKRNDKLSNCVKEREAVATADKINHQKNEISDLATANDKLNDVVKKLQKERNDSTIKAKSELVQVKKEFREEIKAWRKELGEERRSRIKSENRFEKFKMKTEASEKNIDASVSSSNSAISSSSNQPGYKEPPKDEISCTICAETIHKYVPKYFLGTEINPACDGCQDSSSSSESDQNFDDETEYFT